MDAKELYAALAVQFQPESCTEVFPVKGLQTDHCRQVERVYTATFASREVFDALERSDARRCVLFTHHPVPQRPVNASDYPPISKEDLALMRAREISLFSYHIPLDRNGPYSPGTNLVRALDATPREAFYFQNGVNMGLICDSPFHTAEEAPMRWVLFWGTALRCIPTAAPTAASPSCVAAQRTPRSASFFARRAVTPLSPA